MKASVTIKSFTGLLNRRDAVEVPTCFHVIHGSVSALSASLQIILIYIYIACICDVCIKLDFEILCDIFLIKGLFWFYCKIF